MIHRRLLRLAGAVPGAIIGLAVFGILLSALHIAFAIAAGAMISALVRNDDSELAALSMLTAIAVARGVVIWVREPITTRVGASVRIELRQRLLTQLNAVPIAERDSGQTVATIVDGVEGLDAYYTRYLPQLMVVLIVPAVTVALVMSQSSSAGVILAIAAAIAVLVPRVWDARLLRNGRSRWERFGRLSSDYVEALQHIPLLRAFGAAGRTSTQLAERADGLRRSTMTQLRVSILDTVITSLATHLGTILVVVATIVAVVSGDTRAAVTVTVVMLARECFRPVQDLSTNWHAGYLGLTAVDGLDRLLRLRPAVIETGKHPNPATAGSVGIVNLSYRYPATANGISELTLKIAPGETVAIIGPSGSGKSTLARLLEREIEPDSGHIVIDGIPLHGYTPHARSRSVVVVPQDPVLFAWTVRDNLRLYKSDATDSEIEDAARTADIHEVIQALPSGYDTLLAENGEQLSGGQRQRIAIARALLSPAPVLVLDEVTSALDADTEQRVMNAIAGAEPKRTTLLIAHRDTARTHATRRINLNQGKISGAADGPASSRPPTRGGSQ